VADAGDASTPEQLAGSSTGLVSLPAAATIRVPVARISAMAFL
jgi:hypothetical protein